LAKCAVSLLGGMLIMMVAVKSLPDTTGTVVVIGIVLLVTVSLCGYFVGKFVVRLMRSAKMP